MLTTQQLSGRGRTRLLGFAALAVLAVVALCVAVSSVLAPLMRLPPGVAFAVGKAGDFAPSTVELRMLPAAFEDFNPTAGFVAAEAAARGPGTPPWPVPRRVAPVPVYLTSDEQGTLRAFYQFDPWSTCAIPFQRAEGEFIDPCWGSHYNLAGECVGGPCKQGLNRFAIERRLDGTLVVRIDRFQHGPLRTNDE